MYKKLAEWLGWYGVVAILVAYILLSFDVIYSNSLSYQLFNLTGGIGIVITSLVHRNYPPAALNVIWSIVAIIAIIRLFL